MATYNDLHNFVYENEYELEETESGYMGKDFEIYLEIDGEIYTCTIADIDEYDGKLVLKAEE